MEQPPGTALWPQLLMREFCLLAFMSGLVTQRVAGPGLFFFACVVLFALYASKVRDFLPDSRGYVSGWFLGLVLLFCAALGLGYAQWRERTDGPAPEPSWLVALLAEDEAATPARTAMLRGHIERTEPTGPGALRVFVRGLQPLPADPLPSASEEFFQPYDGLAMLTLYGFETAALPYQALPGQTLSGAFKLMRVRNLANDGVFDLEQYWRDRGVAIRGWNTASSSLVLEGEGKALAALRNTLRLRFLAALPQWLHAEPLDGSLATPAEEQPEAMPEIAPGFAHLFGTPQALLPALIFGDRDLLSPRQQELFQHATLSHSLSLSGLHLGYAVAIGLFLAKVVASLSPRVLLRLPLPRLVLVLALPLAMLYMWLGQYPVSLVRAGLMLFFAVCLVFINRPRALIDGLLVALLFILVWWPSAIFDLSLQLSALSMAVIAFWANPLLRASKAAFPIAEGVGHRTSQEGKGQHSLASALKSWKKPLRVALFTLLLSTAIQLALAPLIAKTFGTMSLWFPLNVLWLPVLGFVVMPAAFIGLALSTLGLTAAASLFLALATLPCAWLLALLEWMDAAGILAPSAILRPTWLTCAGFWLLCLSVPPLLLRLYRVYRTRRQLARQGVAAPLLPGFATEPSGASVPGVVPRVAPLMALVVVACVLTIGSAIYGYYKHNVQSVSVRLLDVGQGQAVLVT